jgi:hypothetical protein
MDFNDILRKTKIDEKFSDTDEARIIAAMKTAYTKSPTAKEMFENWVSKPGQTINIKITQGGNEGDVNTGNVYLNPSSFNQLNYINNYGTAVRYTLLGGLIHEFGHALSGKRDPNVRELGDRLTDYQDTNIPFVNDIWSELTFSDVRGLDLMISYTGTATSEYQKLGFAYTKNQPIVDTAINVDYLNRNKAADATTSWSTVKLGVSNDLLIGGSRKNTLESGAGDDFLFGGGDDDTLRGGAGKDTAIYLGNQNDYDIKQNTYFKLDGLSTGWKWDGTWTVRHARNTDENDDGTDRLENIEYVRFGNGERYKLTANGLTFQSDLAFVFDTTRSMDLNGNIQVLDYVKQQASALTTAIFANGQDARVEIVTYKDAENGEPSQVILPFTDQDNFADRQSATIAAIDSLTASGGGDTAETGFDGLRLALNNALGQWRSAAGTLRVVLFTDSPLKDYEIANEVSELAHNIGATVGTSSTETLPGGYIDTYSLALGISYGGAQNYNYCDNNNDPCCQSGVICGLTGEAPDTPFVSANEPIEIVPMTAQVQIFTIFTGPAGTNTKALEAIANANGGTFQTASTSNDLFNKLLEIVSAPTVEATPTTISAIATDFEAVETKLGEIIDPGQFVLTRTGDLSQSLTVAYTLSGIATNGSDYQNLMGAVAFAAGESSTKIDLNILDDNTAESLETVTLTLAENSNYTLDSNNSDTITIFDNDFLPTQLVRSTANSLSIEGGEGQSLLKFTKLSNTGNNKNELAAFVVDDEQGSIDGILPGDEKYVAAAIAKSQVIFSSLGDNSLDRQFDLNSQRYLNFSSGDRIQFLLVVDDTIDSINANLDNGIPVANVIFSLPAANLNNSTQSQFTVLPDSSGYQIAWSDKLDGSNNKFDNFVIQVQASDGYTVTSGIGLQGGSMGEVIDLRDFSGQTLKVDLSTVSDAAYNNHIGFYAVNDELGTLANGLKPGDIGYAEAAIRSAVLQSSKNDYRSDLSITGGTILAPVVIANGTFQDFIDSNPQNQANNSIHAYFNYLGANTDRVDHFRLLGDNKFGVEDLYGGGDRDYNDLIVQLTVKN